MRRFATSERAATAAEFALVLPVALIFFFGIIDTGRYMWSINEMEKAVQAGARAAVTTDAVVGALDSADFSTACGGLAVGDRITCTDAMPQIVCDSTNCSPVGGSCGVVVGTKTPYTGVDCKSSYRAAAFGLILARVQQIAPFVRPADVTVTYSPSGLGYNGDPACFGDRATVGGEKNVCPSGELPDIAPLTTVRIEAPRFRPSLAPFASFRLPSRAYSLTLEDGRGTWAY